MALTATPAPQRSRRWPARFRVLIALVMLTVLGALAGLGAVIMDRGSLLTILPARDTSGGLGTADGYQDRMLNVQGDVPAVTQLRPALLAAVRQAARAAAQDGIDLKITSGWRSPHYQQHLLDQAVKKYGSYKEARRWVSTPTQSRHVTGDAVDIGPTDAADWTTRHGQVFGLCQVYGNEMWHFELLTEPGGQCPPLRTDGSS